MYHEFGAGDAIMKYGEYNRGIIFCVLRLAGQETSSVMGTTVNEGLTGTV